MNAREGGGEAHGALIRPAIIYPVNEQMRVWQEEQFGPVIPVAVYDDIEEVYAYLATSPYGQQAAVFSGSSAASAPVLDVLSTVVGRININTQCSRYVPGFGDYLPTLVLSSPSYPPWLPYTVGFPSIPMCYIYLS